MYVSARLTMTFSGRTLAEVRELATFLEALPWASPPKLQLDGMAADDMDLVALGELWVEA